MGNNTLTIDEAEAASLLDWWLEAGVDVAVAEQPRDWTRARVAAPVAPAELPPPPSSGKLDTLAAFHAWLAAADRLPLARPNARRVLPQGREAASLMVLADLPGPEEAARSQPIAGEAWVLAQRMLAAIGVRPDEAYIASLACFHVPGVRPSGEELDRCAQIARDHVRLARPGRLLLFGDAAAKALTGQPLARARGKVHRIESIRTVATFHPRWLLQRPSDKALAWADLLLLMSEEG
ncbi:uracil-DNA glycosylase family protein [Sphingomonas sp. ASV193]|uniref:uracil-DNA glycosylase family protein n=1 Tax=Sphingomonas sp. ASV193 TaxID=3144405 RepID=UPI0032E8CAA6